MLFRTQTLTREAVMKMDEAEVFKQLTEKLTDYCAQRVFWLLHDIGRKEGKNEGDKQSITQQVGSSVREIVINDIHYDDAKELLLELIENDRFVKGSRSKSMVIGILQEAMNDLSIHGVRYNQRTKRRELIVENKKKK